MIFAIERQWKEDNPYFKVTSSNHSYFNDMGMPKLLKSVEKVDDYTVKITLNMPEAPFLSDLAMEYAGVQSKEYADAMLKAGTPEKIDQEPIGTGPFYARAIPEGRHHPLQGLPAILGRQGEDRRPHLLDHAGRLGALGQAAEGRMPGHALPESGRPRRDPQGPERRRCWSSPASTSATSPTTRTKKPFDDVRVRKAINMAINKKAIIDAVYLSTGIAAKNPIPPTMWSYNNAIKDDPYDPAAAKKLLAEAGYPERLRRPISGRCRCSGPYNPNAKRIAELMQADLAKIGVKAEIKSYEWGEYRKRDAGRRAPDGHARLDRRQRRPGQLPQHAARLRRGQDRRPQRRQVVLPAVRRPGAEGQDAHRPEASATKLYEQAQVIFKEQAPWFTIAHSVQLKPVRKEVIDFKLTPFGRHTFYGVDMK